MFRWIDELEKFEVLPGWKLIERTAGGWHEPALTLINFEAPKTLFGSSAGNASVPIDGVSFISETSQKCDATLAFSGENRNGLMDETLNHDHLTLTSDSSAQLLASIAPEYGDAKLRATIIRSFELLKTKTCDLETRVIECPEVTLEMVREIDNKIESQQKRFARKITNKRISNKGKVAWRLLTDFVPALRQKRSTGSIFGGLNLRPKLNEWEQKRIYNRMAEVEKPR